MNKRGLFITMEGGEGVGKSTNLTFLKNYLIDNGVDVVTTREPGGTQLGEQIRELLLQVRQQKMCAITELLLIFAARAQHILEFIEPNLAAGKWVYATGLRTRHTHTSVGAGVLSGTRLGNWKS